MIKLDEGLSREIIILCKDNDSVKVMKNLIHDQLRKNSNYINNRIQMHSVRGMLHVCFDKGIDIPDISLKFRNCYITDYVECIKIICYNKKVPGIFHSLEKQLCETQDYIKRNLMIYTSYNITSGDLTLGQVNISFKGGKDCKSLPDIIIKGEYKMNKKRLGQKVYDYMMKTSGQILEISEDKNMKVYLSEELNIIASNMAEFANNILKESIEQDDTNTDKYINKIEKNAIKIVKLIDKYKEENN